jgi:drug/metabolite transporter (DMT)-like permease
MPSRTPPSWISLPPPVAMATGALGVSTSAVFIDLSGSSPGTATFYRCALAVLVLAPLVVLERRSEGAPTRRQCAYAVAAGVLFAGDALWWTQAIGEIGAGLSTVLVNAQVVIVPLLALVLDREPVTRRYLASLPVMVVGILLTGGVLESGLSGADPVAGTVHGLLAAACYSGFLYLLRLGGGSGRIVQSYVLVLVTAAAAALGLGPFWSHVTLRPPGSQLAWLVLVALGGQVVGWLLVAVSTPHLRPEVGAALLLLTPVGALAGGAVFLEEHPTPLQLAGCALVLISAYVVSVRTSRI